MSDLPVTYTASIPPWGIKAKFSFNESVLGIPAALEIVLGESSAISSCLSRDVTRALRYCVS